MTKKRDLNLDKYSISRNRYRELYYFCRQYKENERKLRECYEITSRTQSEVKTKNKKDPTAIAAAKAAELTGKLRLVEQAAIEAAPNVYQWLIRNVTEEIPFSVLNPPCGEASFREMRRKFFYILDKLKE